MWAGPDVGGAWDYEFSGGAWVPRHGTSEFLPDGQSGWDGRRRGRHLHIHIDPHWTPTIQ